MQAYPKPTLLIIALLGFLVLISPIIAWCVFYALKIEAVLGIGTTWFLIVGVILLLLAASGTPLLLKYLERLSERATSKADSEVLLKKLEKKDMPLEEVTTVVKELSKRKDSRVFPYILEILGALFEEIKIENYLLLIREREINALINTLADLGTESSEVIEFLNRFLAVLDECSSSDPLFISARNKIINAVRSAGQTLSERV